MPTIAIAEDDPAARAQLKEYVERYGQKRGETIEVICFPDGLELVEGYAAGYDIILLDIEMPHLDGMSAARKIRKRDEDVLILFITNMAKYAINGYEVEALGFMLKPVSYGSLALKLDKAFAYLHSRAEKYLMLPVEDGVKRVSASEIQYIEVIDHRLHFHAAKETYVVRGSLQDIEKELAGQHFTRCNKGYLVNLRHIQEIKREYVRMDNRDKLLISRRKKEEFLLAVTEYYGKGGR